MNSNNDYKKFSPYRNTNTNNSVNIDKDINKDENIFFKNNNTAEIEFRRLLIDLADSEDFHYLKFSSRVKEYLGFDNISMNSAIGHMCFNIGIREFLNKYKLNRSFKSNLPYDFMKFSFDNLNLYKENIESRLDFDERIFVKLGGFGIKYLTNDFKYAKLNDSSLLPGYVLEDLISYKMNGKVPTMFDVLGDINIESFQ